jgi:hypothetical protein
MVQSAMTWYFAGGQPNNSQTGCCEEAGFLKLKSVHRPSFLQVFEQSSRDLVGTVVTTPPTAQTAGPCGLKRIVRKDVLIVELFSRTRQQRATNSVR